MGADKTIYTTQELTNEQIEEILTDLGMSFSKQYWGWSSEIDVSKTPEGLHIHYGYWGIEHANNAHKRTKQIIRELRKRNLVKKIGRWGY